MKYCCNLCGSAENRCLISQDKKVHAPQHHVIYRQCSRCSFVSLDIDYENWKNGYNKDKFDLNKLDIYFEQQKREAFNYLSYFGKHYEGIETKSRGRVLEVGSAVSGCLSLWKERRWEVFGVEPNKFMVEYSLSQKGIGTLCSFYERNLFEKGKFDVIISYHVLEHSTRPYEMVCNFNYHLKKGGFLHVEVPNLWYTEVCQLGWGHVSMFTPTTIRQILERAQFEVIDFHKKSYS